MKISNETKVGILTITALTILILGFNFLKGKDVFNQSEKIYAVFTDLGPLTKSNEVKINGYVIGKVYSLDASDASVNGIVATIHLTEDVNIPRDSKAFIASPLVGASYLVIEKGTQNVFLKSGDTLNTRIDNGILDDVKAQLTPTLNKVRNSLDSLNVVMSGINNILNSEARVNLQTTLANLAQSTHSLKGLLNNESGALAKTLNNANSITENIKKNNDSITAVISSAKRATDNLASIDVKPAIDSIQAAIGQLKSFVARVNSTKGSLGALINDRQLYNKLNDAIISAELLMDDLRTHPKRYVNLSVFGKKDRSGPLTSPTPKDSTP